MKCIHPNNKSFKSFIEFWRNYCPLEKEHVYWASSNFEFIEVKRHQILYEDSYPQKNMFLVCRGMIANIIQMKNKRTILNIAMANMALTTTTHLFSKTKVSGEIIALRSGSVLRISYSQLHKMMHMDPCIDTLISILSNKQQRFLHNIRLATSHGSPRDRFRQFAHLLTEVLNQTTQKEQSQLLGISRDTVQKSKKELLFSYFFKK